MNNPLSSMNASSSSSSSSSSSVYDVYLGRTRSHQQQHGRLLPTLLTQHAKTYSHLHQLDKRSFVWTMLVQPIHHVGGQFYIQHARAPPPPVAAIAGADDNDDHKLVTAFETSSKLIWKLGTNEEVITKVMQALRDRIKAINKTTSKTKTSNKKNKNQTKNTERTKTSTEPVPGTEITRMTQQQQQQQQPSKQQPGQRRRNVVPTSTTRRLVLAAMQSLNPRGLGAAAATKTGNMKNSQNSRPTSSSIHYNNQEEQQSGQPTTTTRLSSCYRTTSWMECYTLFVNNDENYSRNMAQDTNATGGQTTIETRTAVVLALVHAKLGLRPGAATTVSGRGEEDEDDYHNYPHDTEASNKLVVQEFIQDMQEQNAAQVSAFQQQQHPRPHNHTNANTRFDHSSRRVEKYPEDPTEYPYDNSDPVLLRNPRRYHTLTDERKLLLDLANFPWCAASVSSATTPQSTTLPLPLPSPSSSAIAVADSTANTLTATTTTIISNNNTANNNDDTAQSTMNETEPWDSSYHQHLLNNNNNNNTDIHMNTYNNTDSSNTNTKTNGLHQNYETEDSDDEDTTTDNYYDEAEDELVF